MARLELGGNEAAANDKAMGKIIPIKQGQYVHHSFQTILSMAA